MSIPRKHHYLPEFYTRRWLNADGLMTRYARVHGGRMEARRVSPGAIGFERDLYRIPGLAPELAQQIESRVLSGLDRNAAEVARRLLEGDIPRESKARSDWARFLMAFWYRAPEDLQALKDAYIAQVTGDRPDIAWADGELEQLALLNLPKFIDNANMGQVLVNMEWTVFDLSGSRHALLTSDRPVLMSNGLAPPEGNYAIPLSPTHIFAASWGGEVLARFRRLSPTRMAAIANKITVERARRFVLARADTQRVFVENRFGAEPVPGPMQSILTEYLKRLAA